MDRNDLERPTFLTLWLEHLADSSRAGKVSRIFPYRILMFLAVGALVQRFLSSKFYGDASVGIPIYA